jgi:hypothetical protein
VALEGFVYAQPRGFYGDFADIGAQPAEWFQGGLYYGPLFMLEYGHLHGAVLTAIAYLNGVLFAGALLAAVWLALAGRRNPLLAVFIVAIWLADQAAAVAFSTNEHLEFVELLGLSAAAWFAVSSSAPGVGLSIGLAAAAKTIPGIFVPYLALLRQWRSILWAIGGYGILFAAACIKNGVSPVEGAVSLVIQKSNMGNISYCDCPEKSSLYIQSMRAAVARLMPGHDTAIMLTWIAASLAIAGTAAYVLTRQPLERADYPLAFGIIGCAMLLITPLAHHHYFILLLPAFTALLLSAGSDWRLWAGFTAAYVLNAFPRPLLSAAALFRLPLEQNYETLSLRVVGIALLFIVECWALAIVQRRRLWS